MFPTLIVSVSGMNPDALYTVHLDILPADDRRYKFVQTDWIAVGKAEKRFTYGEYVHPESPNAGRHWMNKAISFKLLKLTNNKHTTYHDQVSSYYITTASPSLTMQTAWLVHPCVQPLP